MTADLGEQRNLAEQEPEIVNRLRALLEKQIADGRSTPGPKLANDIDRIIIDKPPQTSHRLTQ
jgi:arylsulfatase A